MPLLDGGKGCVDILHIQDLADAVVAICAQAPSATTSDTSLGLCGMLPKRRRALPGSCARRCASIIEVWLTTSASPRRLSSSNT